MKLELIRGCICDSLNIDDEREIDLTDEQRREVLNKILKHLKPEDLNHVLQALIPVFGEYECSEEPCECCGDFVETYTWKIDEEGNIDNNIG